MSEEIIVLIGLGVALLVAVGIFMKCCKADGYIEFPKPARRPLNLPIGTKVHVKCGNQVRDGVIADNDGFKYVVEMHDIGTGNKSWYITYPGDVWVRKGENENE